MGGFGIALFLGVMWGLGLLISNYRENPTRYSPLFQSRSDFLQHNSRSNKKYKVKAIHEVRSGDTMWEIARTFGITVSALREVNDIGRGSRIYVGQKLRIPSMTPDLNEQNEINRGLEVVVDSNSNDNETKTTYKIRRGDTLYDIASRFGTTTIHLREINGLRGNSRIRIGQELYISRQNRNSRNIANKLTESSRLMNRNQSSIPEIAMPEEEFQQLENDILGMKKQLYDDKIGALKEIEELYNANQISENEKNEYVKLVTNYNPLINNFKTKIIGFETLPKRQKDKLVELIYNDKINSDSIHIAPNFWDVAP